MWSKNYAKRMLFLAFNFLHIKVIMACHYYLGTGTDAKKNDDAFDNDDYDDDDIDDDDEEEEEVEDDHDADADVADDVVNDDESCTVSSIWCRGR